MSKMTALSITAIAGSPAVSAVLPVVLVTLIMLLTLKSGDSDVITSGNVVIVPFLYH